MQAPSIGRIVIVPMDPKVNNGADEAPAIITRVHSDTCVNVRVLADQHETTTWRTSCTLSAEKPDDVAPGSARAWWPPRV